MPMGKDLSFNKRAIFDYDLQEKLEAGLQLLGTEVKSVRAGHMSLRGAFVTIHNDELFLTNATIPPWQVKNAPGDYDPLRSRKLLIRKEELKRLIGAKSAQGLTIVPIRTYDRHGKLKLEIALARGKKKYEKKEQKKARDIQRDVDRTLRGKEV